MKTLLDNRFAPITFTFGFVECPFAQFSQAFTQWRDQIDAKFGTQTSYKSFSGPLSESLFALEPLSSPQDRYLLTETRSGWCAVFANGLRTNDVFSPVSYLPTLLRCRGLDITCVSDRSDIAGQEGIQVYGAVKFALYGPATTDWLNLIRSVSAVMNDEKRWEFGATGEIQPFEQTENYQKRKVVDRFTPVMLESYCAALGIDLFNSEFYGEQNLLVHSKGRNSRDFTMSLAEARSRALA